MGNDVVTRARVRADAALHSPSLDTLPPELIVVHVLPYLTNGEKGALAKTCSRLLRLLCRERLYRLSSLCTRRHFEDAAFREEVNTRIPTEKLVLHPFECAIRAFHFAPFAWKRARTLFEEVLADENATEVEKARARLSLVILSAHSCADHYDYQAERQRATANTSASLLFSAGDEADPVRAFEMGYVHYGGVVMDNGKAHSLFVSSANGGCAAGMHYLGLCLFYGDGVSRDESAGAAQWEKAAAMGHFGAMYFLGDCLFHGTGISRDEARGVALIRCAAVDEGSFGAKNWLEMNRTKLKQRGFEWTR